MAHVYVHYFVDSVNGLVKIHFSASQYKSKVFVRNKTMFTLAVTGMQQIPSGDKLWDAPNATWNVHADVWIKLMPYYTCAPEIYGMIPYITKAQWTAFISGKVAYDSEANPLDPFARQRTSAMSDAEKAAQFFGTAAFNQAVYVTATVNSDREELLSLLGLNQWGEFDSLLSDPVQRKKVYRAAAIKHHPDKNGGDGSKMSKLNELWGIYGAF